MLPGRRVRAGRVSRRAGEAGVTARWLAPVGRRCARRVVAAGTGLVVAAAQFVVPVAAAAVVVTAASVVVSKTAAKAATGSVLILSTSVNGGASSAEAQAVPSGYSVTVDDASAWGGLTTAQFAGYSAIIIGDPSSGGTCSSSVPSAALNNKATWESAITGNVAIVGTAPALAGSAGTSLMSSAIAYAVAGSGTGLYVSLNCEDSADSAGTAVGGTGSAAGWLNGVEGIGTAGLTDTGRAGSCPNSGTVNTWERLNAPGFSGLASSALASWGSPACSVEESFSAWPANFTPVAYDAAATPLNFTASDGTSGQPYVLLGQQPLSQTQTGQKTLALAPSVGGEVPAGATAGGSSPAAPGVAASVTSVADGVNAANGDFTQPTADLSIPTFGPSLDFARSYDAQAAQQQTVTGTPGPMGYGWTDNWATSLTKQSQVPGDISTMDGLATSTGEGGPPTSAAMNQPHTVFTYNGNTYIADTLGNRVEEIPGTSMTQFGIPMTAGDIYTIAGSPTGAAGESGDGTPAASSLLHQPKGIAIDGNGDLFIADTDNCRVVEIAATSHTQWGSISMTQNDIYTVAGRNSSNCTIGNDNKAATSSNLNSPVTVKIQGSQNDLYIADAGNNRIQMVAGESAVSEWGISSTTAGFVYTVAGSSAGTSGSSGDGGPATSALLNSPEGVWVTGVGLFIGDTFNCRVQEVARSSGTQWGTISMTQNDIYTIAGRNSTQCAVGNDNKAATSSDLNYPAGVMADNGGQLYIADSQNNRIQEVAATAHTEWGQSMTVGFVYTIAGSAAGSGGHAGDGGAATSALLSHPQSVNLDRSFNLYIADTSSNEIREVSVTSSTISDYAGGVGMFAQDGNGGPAVTAGLDGPYGLASDGHGDVFAADTFGNRVQEIASYTHTQFGIAMTAGDVYTVAGQQGGYQGIAGDGGPATSALLDQPTSVAVDATGNLYIADSVNNRIQKVSASTGNISTVAGSATGAPGNSGQGGPATSALLDAPYAVAVDANGNLFISGNITNQVQEVPAASGNGMTAGDIYTIAGSTAGTAGSSGDGGPATSALLKDPEGVTVDAAGNVYISDEGNNRVQEVPAASGNGMTAGHIYTIAGNASGTAGNTGDQGPAPAALLHAPGQLAADSSGNLYITDMGNNRVREIAARNGTQWAQAMTAGDIYNVAGNISGTSGFSGDGGAATSALLNAPLGIGVGPAGDLFITDSLDNHLREVAATATATFAVNPSLTGITITQPGGAQATFYPIGTGCTGPYVPVGNYCTLPQNVSAALTYNSSANTYTFTPAPGISYTYDGTSGALMSETDAAGNTLTITYVTQPQGAAPCPTTASWCAWVTAVSGRGLVLGYNASNRVTSVTDPMGRQWTYGYSSSDLASVTDPMGNLTTYTYGQGSTGNPQLANDLLTITSPNAQPGGPDAGDATVNVYNTTGQITSQTDPMGYQTTFSYCVNAATGNCMNASTGTGNVTVTHPDGTTAVFNYTQGTLTAATTWNGASPSEQDFGPNLAAGTSGGTLLDSWTTDTGGNRTTFAYDQAGNLTSATDPLGNVTTMWSTSLGAASCTASTTAASPCSQSQPGPAPVTPGAAISPPSAAPPAGVTYALYDTSGNVLYSAMGVYQPGSSTASSVQTEYTLYKGNSVSLNGTSITCAAAPPSPSLACATIDASGTVTQLGYDAQGDLTSSSTPDGNGSEVAKTTYAYDGDVEQTSATSPDGNLSGANAGNYTTVTAYNADGETTSVTQVGGSGATVTPRTTSYGYDGNGNQTTVTDPRGYITTTAYNADDEATTVTDPDGNTALTCYDAVGMIAQTVPPAGVAVGGLTAASCPKNYPAGYGNRLAADATTYTFNASGQETSMTTPAPAGQSGPQTTTLTYTAAGLPATITSPPNSNAQGAPSQVTRDTYDANGQLLTQTTGYGTPAASTTSYCYDPNGNHTAVVAPDGNISGTAACETSSPWVISSSAYPTQAAYQTTSSYDSAGELVSTTAPATSAAPGGATTSMTYDPAGDLLTATDPKGITATFTYNPVGLGTGVSYSGSSAHAASYGYDAEGNLTSMTDGTGTSSYSYDPFGELTSATNGAGQKVGYGYDADGNATSITYPLPASATWATSSTVSYGYDNASLLTSGTDFNGNKIAIGNTADGLPSSLTLGSSGDTITTAYDQTGAPSAITVKNSTSTMLGFTYADAPSGDILSETDTPASAKSPAVYTYDALGRVTSMTPGSGSTLNYGFDASSNLTTLPPGSTTNYDYAGELTSSTLSGTTTSYTYDADGQRLTAKQGSATTAAGTWNGAGQLTAYNTTAANMTAATYDGNGLRATAATTPSGGSASTQNFVWDASSNLLMDSANAYIYDGGTAPAEQVSLATGKISYLAADSLGSVRGIIDSTGSLNASTSYDAWGNPQTAGGLSSYTPFGYAGGYTDPTGLIYLVNRHYDPATGQFLSVDPAADQTGQPYAYAGGNPVSYSDPLGLWAVGLITGQVYYSEADFHTWLNGILGVGVVSGTESEYRIAWHSGAPKYLRNFGDRRVDIRTGNHWLNELKTGKTYNTWFVKGEAERDWYLVKHGLPYVAEACHPNAGRCTPFAVAGAIWWFSARGTSGCQSRDDGRLCASRRLRANLRGKGINRIYVILAQRKYRRLWIRFWASARVRAEARKALLRTTCPYPALNYYIIPFKAFPACNNDG